MNEQIQRSLQVPKRSFFLFGPRAVGKSYWLKQNFPNCIYINLLDQKTSLQLTRDPSLLAAQIHAQSKKKQWVVIDEIQKVPGLLDEVHLLMEEHDILFALSGSSARKLKRSGANLLAGRAITRSMGPLSFSELKQNFSLQQALQWGTLPLVYLSPQDAVDILEAYVHTYIREEIREEGLVRKSEPFIRFLSIAAQMNGQQLNKGNIAREAQVPRSTVDTYFSILEDTLLGHYLPAYRPAAQVREQQHPKFYWFDPGVARGASEMLYDPVDSLWQGRALETLIYHELRVYNQVSAKHRPIYFYRSGAGAEIDFIIETKKSSFQQKSQVVCLEVKLASRWDRRWEKAMRNLAQSSKLKVEKMIGLYQGKERYRFDQLEVWPVEFFLEKLFQGEVF